MKKINKKLIPKKEIQLTVDNNAEVTTISCKAQLNIVDFNFTGSLKVITAPGYHSIATVPIEYRPKNDIYFQANISGMVAILLGVITTTGIIQINVFKNQHYEESSIGLIQPGINFRINVTYIY